jgi:hypothetical protein
VTAVHEQILAGVAAALAGVAWEGGTPQVVTGWRAEDLSNVTLPALKVVVQEEADVDEPWSTEHVRVAYRAVVYLEDRADVVDAGKRALYLRWREQAVAALRYREVDLIGPEPGPSTKPAEVRGLDVAEFGENDYQLFRSGFVMTYDVPELY